MAEQKRESFKNYKSESYNDNNTSISYIRQSLIMLTAYSLNNANSRSNSYHKLLLENLSKQNMLQNTTFISANYDIHIDNAIASLYAVSYTHLFDIPFDKEDNLDVFKK